MPTMTMTMTVKYVNPPKAGKQRGSIKGADDQILGVFADKVHLFEPGSTYEIEYTETVSSGVTYRNVKSATAVAAPAAPANAVPPAGFNTYRETSANDAKRMFVCANLSALIRAGEVKNDKVSLWNATHRPRSARSSELKEGSSDERANPTSRRALCRRDPGPRDPGRTERMRRTRQRSWYR
jgi:hypothetical protein